jgi:two-component system OmpR family sensor kinase
MNKLGIRVKLLLVFTTVTLFGGLLLFVSAGWQLQQATLAFYQRDLQSAALTMANVLVEPMGEQEDEEPSGRNLQAILERNQTSSGWMFTVLDRQGRVLASTYEPRYALGEPLPYSSELYVALKGQTAHAVRHNENGDKFAYVAVPILYENQVVGVVRGAASMAPAYRQARQKWFQLAAVALPILLLTVAVALWFGRTLTRPIRELHASALRIAEGALDERVSVQSADEIGQLADAFNFMTGRINILLSAQRNFVSNAAHELRAPLMSLKLRCEALYNQPLNETQKARYQSELAQEIDHMSDLIAQLLILARLDEGRHEAGQAPGDTVAFLHDIARTWRIRASAANLQFGAEIPAALPDVLVAAGDLQIILENLLSNAVKYTPAGGRVALRAQRDTGTLRLIVIDSGEGFTPEEQSQLFQRFSRIVRRREEDIAGTGLGLAIVKAVLDRYGGTITASSDGPNQGATFTVTLPLEKSSGK